MFDFDWITNKTITKRDQRCVHSYSHDCMNELYVTTNQSLWTIGKQSRVKLMIVVMYGGQ